MPETTETETDDKPTTVESDTEISEPETGSEGNGDDQGETDTAESLDLVGLLLTA